MHVCMSCDALIVLHANECAMCLYMLVCFLRACESVSVCSICSFADTIRSTIRICVWMKFIHRGQLISKCECEWRLHYNFASVWNWFLLIANVCASINHSNRDIHIRFGIIHLIVLVFLLHFGVNPFGNYQYVNRLEFQCDRIALRVCHLM